MLRWFQTFYENLKKLIKNVELFRKLSEALKSLFNKNQ